MSSFTPSPIFSNLTVPEARFDVALGVFQLLAVILGIILNLTCLPYFLRKKPQLCQVLYILIILTDITICISCLPNAVSMLHSRHIRWFENNFICGASGFLFAVASPLSVFLIAVLSVARAISISFPFFKINTRVYTTTTTIYFLLHTIVAFLPFTKVNPHLAPYSYSDEWCQCSWFIIETDLTTLLQSLYLLYFAPWIVPGAVVLLAGGTSLYHTIKAKSRLGITVDREAESREVTITILIVTSVYVVFNTPVWAFWTWYIREYTLHQGQPTSTYFIVFLKAFISHISVVLNSFVNPIIYLARIRGLRKYIWRYAEVYRSTSWFGRSAGSAPNANTTAGSVIVNPQKSSRLGNGHL